MKYFCFWSFFGLRKVTLKLFLEVNFHLKITILNVHIVKYSRSKNDLYFSFRNCYMHTIQTS